MEIIANIDFDLQAIASDIRSDPLKQRTGLAGRLYPNGEFTLGVVPPKRVSEKERQFNADFMDQYIELEVWTADYRGFRIEQKRYFKNDDSDLLAEKLEASLIGLSLPTNSHNPELQNISTASNERKPRGSKGITSYGKRMIRNGAWLIQKSVGLRRLGFLTLTLPSFPDRQDILCVLISEWSELVRQFFQEFNREIERKGKVPCWVGCTEIQEERFDGYGQPCPHLHAAYVAHSGNHQWYISADRMRAIWKRILEARIEAVFGEDIDVDTKPSIDCQSVKQDASAYLSKYLSKGGDILEKMKEEGYSDFIPSAWWHCSLKLKRTVKSLVSEVPSDLKLAVKQGVDLVERGVAIYVFNVEIDGKRYGWVGKLKRKSSIDKSLLNGS